MRLDVDTIIYIIISIAILVLSGLGGARKRRAQNLRAPAGGSREGTGQVPGRDASVSQPGMDAFDRLERMFTGEMAYEDAGEDRDETTSEEKETGEEEKPAAEEVRAEELPEEGGSTLKSSEIKETGFDSGQQTVPDTGDDERGLSVDELFRNVKDVKKAVIYSEIFNRKYT